MKVLWIIIALMGILSSPSYAGAGEPLAGDKNIEKADRLGEKFQRQGPWSRKEPQDGLFYGIPQPGEYLATPESQLPKDDSGVGITQYPLCYNPYTGSYEYCYPRGSSNFRARFRSADFRSWWRRGGACPPGYYFMPGEGCYRR
jgi:hypothetical protein